MKSLRIIVISLILGFTLNQSIAQSKTTIVDTLWVGGNCEMCKNRIENALDLKGIKKAKWTAKDQKLVLVYKPNKVKMENITQALLDIGHDVENLKAKDSVYATLHHCCKYRSN